MHSLCRPLAYTFVAFTLAGCSTEYRHRIIVYDRPYSIAAAPRNLHCASEFRVSCDLETRAGEADFSKKLTTAFRAAPECATVTLLVDSGSDKGSSELENKVARNPGYEYWRLRVDYHPELDKQPFDLGLGNDRSRVGGDDAEHDAAYICKAAKSNGVMDYR